MVETKRPLARVHKPGVVENCPARLFNDGKSNFDSGARHCFATKRLAILILRTDFAIWEPAEIIGAAQKESLENWHIGSASPLAYRRDFAINQQDEVLG